VHIKIRFKGEEMFDLNTGLLTLNLVLLGWVKLDQISLWKRVNSHKHKANCERKCEIEIDGVLIGEK
jgi:hypothetical protein